MGLDITAISLIKPVEIPEGMEKWSDEYYNWEAENGFRLWGVGVDRNFPEQGEGLPDSEVVDSEGESYSFRAGSYGGYGEWRNDLALAAGHKGGSEGLWAKVDNEGPGGRPFEGLINFPDNDGIIGPVMSKKLYNDFVTQEKDVMHAIDWWYLKMVPEKEYNGDDVKWFKLKYEDWKQAFKVASNNGMVIFM